MNRGGSALRVVGAVVAGLGAYLFGVNVGHKVGLRTGHDRVVVWMLENAVMPEGWSPESEWVDR